MTSPSIPSQRWLHPERAEPLVTYAQHGEDVRLARLFDDVDDGFFVDVGAAHPLIDSVTKHFSERGWTGINIEPGPLYPELDTDRPNEINLRCLIGREPGPATLYIVQPQLGWSTTDLDSIEHLRPKIDSITELEIETRRLDDVLDEHAQGREVHFLKIDVEGAEADVIASIDLRRWRPACLVIEAVATQSNRPTEHRFEKAVLGADYVEAGFDGLNRYYIRGDLASHAPVLAHPLTPVDNSVPFSVLEARHRAEQRLRQATDEAQRTLADVEWRHSVEVSTLERELETQRNELDSALRLILELGQQRAALAELEALRRHIVDLEAHLHGAKVELDEVYRSRTWRTGRAVRRLVRGPLSVAKRARARDRAAVGPATAYEAFNRTSNHWAIEPVERRPESTLPDIEALLPPPGEPIEPERSPRLVAALRELVAVDDEELATLDHRKGAERSAARELLAALDLAPAATERKAAAGGGRVLFDARALQDPNFRSRGIGRVARECLRALADDRLTLLLDPALPLPDSDVLDTASSTVWLLSEAVLADVDLFFNPAPMTAPVTPIVAALSTPTIRSVGVIYDFIPAELPDLYLRATHDRLAYHARLHSLGAYDQLLADSADAASKGAGRTLRSDPIVVVGAPDLLRVETEIDPRARRADRPFLFAPLGADRRKNIPAAVAVAAALGGELDLVVLSHMHDDQRRELDELCASMGYEHERLRVVSDLTDGELRALYREAELCLVPSTAEGFSLPVVEAVAQGTPVVASDIAVHAELIGAGPWLAPAIDVAALAEACEWVLGHHEEALASQRTEIGDAGDPAVFRQRVAEAVGQIRSTAAESPPGAASPPFDRPTTTASARLALVTPWPPSQTGIAIYNCFVVPALARYGTLDIYAPSAPTSTAAGSDGSPIDNVRILSGLPEPGAADVIVSVLGNSHFHIPILEFLRSNGGPAIAHDNRMTEIYAAWEGEHRAAAVMGLDGVAVSPAEIDGWIASPLRTPSLGFGEIMRLAEPLFVHSSSLANRIEQETGARPLVLPFCQTRRPRLDRVGSEVIERARAELGFGDDQLHLATFGIADRQNKGTNVVIEAVAWLVQWGLDVTLHQIGGCPPAEREALELQAEQAGIGHRVLLHPWVSDEDFDRYQLAVDAAAQLRLGPTGQISGAVADCIAFGVPTVCSAWMADDLDAPSFVGRVPSEAISPYLVAEALADLLPRRRADPASIDDERRAYVDRRSPDTYAAALASALGLS